MSQTDRIKEILEKINDGIATSQEVDEFQSWYNSFDDTKLAHQTNLSFSDVKSNVWNNINKKITDKKVKLIAWTKVGSVAAASVLAVFGLYYIKNTIATEPQALSASIFVDGEQKQIDMSLNEFLDTTYYYPIARTLSSEASIQTDKANFTKILLPDGTKVTLNAASKLHLEGGFDDKLVSERTVRLEGEAYFEVKSDPNKQFVVKMADQVIRVLGTKFNVKSLESIGETQTTLYEGKIQLTTTQGNVIVEPNQTVSNIGSKVEFVNKDINKTKDWRNLKFSFDDDLVESVIDQLASQYNLEIVKTSTIPVQRISGQLSKGLSLDEIVQIMANLTGGDFKLSQNKLIVNFNKTN